jgi:hypothetical protein
MRRYRCIATTAALRSAPSCEIACPVHVSDHDPFLWVHSGEKAIVEDERSRKPGEFSRERCDRSHSARANWLCRVQQRAFELPPDVSAA